MQKNLITLILVLGAITLAKAQNCDCPSNFEWVRKTIEENDAGYAYSLQQKGVVAYEQHTKSYAEKSVQIEDIIECAEMIYEWLSFFRSGHLSIRLMDKNNDQSDAEPSQKEIIAQFKDWEKMDMDLKEFKKYLESNKASSYEGIWVSPPYEIGIKKQQENYVGFVIQGDGAYWTKGQVKLKIKPDSTATYFMRDHSAQNFSKAELLGKNVLELGFVRLKRKDAVDGTEANIERYVKAVEATSPYFEIIDNSTNLLRIPDFDYSQKRQIDSVLTAHSKRLSTSPNLIIDIRNNGGGSDASFGEILPILYTNPIRTVGVEYLSTELNNQRMLDFINKGEYGFSDEEKEWAKESYDKLSKELRKFVNLEDEDVTVITYDTIQPYPKQIGILINEGNGSTAEQFLLAAKQSKKVKLIGTTTVGVLDISNMYFVDSPCNQFKLGYSLTKSMRLPEMAIDGKGIQPDYFIDKSIAKYEWIDFAVKILGE